MKIRWEQQPPSEAVVTDLEDAITWTGPTPAPITTVHGRVYPDSTVELELDTARSPTAIHYGATQAQCEWLNGIAGPWSIRIRSAGEFRRALRHRYQPVVLG